MNEQSGRPLSADLDVALVDAAQQMLIADGFGQLSVDRLVKRAGTTRPAFYRRYRNLGDLVLQLLLAQNETHLEKAFDTGTLRTDLIAVQHNQLDFFASPLAQRSFTGFAAALRTDDELRETFYEGFLFPRRKSTAAILERSAARGEILQSFDPEWICDLLTGPVLMRVVFPDTGALDEQLAEQTVNAALAVLTLSPALALR